MRIFSYILCCAFLVGCASTVDTITKDEVLPLSENTGYVLLPVYRNTHIYELRLSGAKYLKFDNTDLRRQKTYLFLQLPQGQYSFSDVRLNKYTVVSDFDGEVWDFDVKAGVINYPGHFVINNHSSTWGTYSLTYQMQNNASMALEYLEKNYPKILASSSVIYSGQGEDDFFSYAAQLNANMEGK